MLGIHTLPNNQITDRIYLRIVDRTWSISSKNAYGSFTGGKNYSVLELNKGHYSKTFSGLIGIIHHEGPCAINNDRNDFVQVHPAHNLYYYYSTVGGSFFKP